ncbi:AAA family ATPase [Pedobacter insulae]|uniref:Helix-turn-helix domain-containing protein n=1 Tax=Pedobacter insulae TaxID=414048 RepID=A0A1I2ZGQ8_9SPHI|nr:AAA family ATPase [Pedobacter insulae]SFH37027.1 Helix-turn-helix domain-containing protein [Pedobacter insulae]
METISENEDFKLALKLINSTNRCIFISGKAGTGKSTFIKHLRKKTYKKFLIVAPTGVAAINAGGVTIHSLFNFPLLPFLPLNTKTFDERKVNSTSKKLLLEIETIIIDEISMVRVDIIDAIDHTLKKIRGSDKSFGGIQVVFIGDLMQLSPIATAQEQALLSTVYESLYFLHSKAYEEAAPIVISLEKIYRQTDKEFVDILNAIRNNSNLEKYLGALNKRIITNPNYQTAITLTTHNAVADEINRESISLVPKQAYSFTAIITGEFDRDNYPTDLILSIKVGARVMLLKNERGKTKKYFNGKIGTVLNIEVDKIEIDFGEDEAFIVQREIWTNQKFLVSATGQGITQTISGTFEQFPLRLAYAITIHKSQGLTFDEAIIDLEKVFVPGQAYVALSRIRSFNGLHLKSPITTDQVLVDQNLVKYLANMTVGITKSNLEIEQNQYLIMKLLETFTISPTLADSGKLPQLIFPFAVSNALVQLIKVSSKFCKELSAMIELTILDKPKLHERVVKAAEYFINQMQTGLINPLEVSIKKYKNDFHYSKTVKELQEIRTYLIGKIAKIKAVNDLTNKIVITNDFSDSSDNISNLERNTTKSSTIVKNPSNDSVQERCYSLFKVGNNVYSISEQLKINSDAVFNHLTPYIQTGEIDILQLVSNEKIGLVRGFYENGKDNIFTLKAQLGATLTFGELKVILAFFKAK